MIEFIPLFTTEVFVAERVVIWKMIFGSLEIRLKSFSINLLLFLMNR
jgi:hypothetical protein